MLWIVGKIFTDFRKYLENNGIEYGIFWDKTLPLPDDLTRPIIRLDFADMSAFSDQLASHAKADVSAVIVAGYENYVLPAAYIAEFYKVPGPNPEAAHAVTDKAVMRQKFIDYDPTISPRFAEVSSWDEMLTFMKSHSFPVILKPASLMKSLLITKNENMAELQANYTTTQQEIERLYDKYSIGQTPKIIVEEFLVGSMHTVAGFVDSYGDPIIVPGVVDCVTGREIGYNDNFLYSRSLPSRLDTPQQEAIVEVARKGIIALGLRSCPVHVEIMLTANGPKIIEIGARLGGYRPRMYEYAYGIDLQSAMIDVAHGKTPNISAKTDRSIAVFEIFPDGEGNFAALDHEGEVSGLSSLRHLSIKAEEGQVIGRASQGYKATAVIILGNENDEQLRKDADFVHHKVAVTLRG